MKLKNEFITLTPATRVYGLKIPVIALTGGIASGKSTVVKYLQSKKITTICADELVKIIYQKPASLTFIKSHFPQVIIDSGNKIDFVQLRDLAFNDNNILNTLQNFIYSQMEEAFKEQLKKLSNPEFILYDIPLLFENKLDKYFDLNILIYCPEEVQLKRLTSRDNIDEKLALKMIKKQMPIETKKSLAKFIINNSGDLNTTHQEIDKLIEVLCLP
ncbi:MAG: dephospho-CoA kinase [Bacteriovoracaceae bacterium]